jgi:hypothetical protein
MPSNPVVLQVQGLSTSSASTSVSSFGGLPVWYPDTSVRPFNIGITVYCSSTATNYNIEHTQQYIGYLSSNFNGFQSSLATWTANTGISGATGNTAGNYAFPVTAIRLNVTTGSSQTVTTAYLVQA